MLSTNMANTADGGDRANLYARGDPMTEERRYLHETMDEIRHQLKQYEKRYYGDDFTEQVLDAERAKMREQLKRMLREPYFGRLDFREEGKAAPVPLYIGKHGLDRSGFGEPRVIDWRAPVASLFYSFTGGDEQVSCEAPDGTISGEVYLKRNIAVCNGELERVVDSYVRGGDNLGLTDEFLLYRLGESKDNRLRDIVSTIQAEQDRIIRAPRDKALIIQGAAGSGKTTVALHRLAFLLYRYQEKLRPERMIIFAPNNLFLDYISGVLPELGAGDIQQTTFADWALGLLGGDVRLADGDGGGQADDGADRPAHSGGVPEGRIKGSLAYKDRIEEALRRAEQGFVPARAFEAWEGTALTAEEIGMWWTETYGRYPIAERRERLIARINRWLDLRLSEIGDASLRKQRAKTARQRLRTYIKALHEWDALSFYREWLEEHGGSCGLSPASVRAALANLKKKRAAHEDLPALVWIHARLHGMKGGYFDHVVIDEAQDVSPFQVFVLKARMRETSFTILGDLAQAIHETKGVHRWEELAQVFDEGETSYHELRQSYRSTMEIIEFANRLIPHTATGLSPAVPVFRSGEDVVLRRIESDEEMLLVIPSYVEEQKAAGMRTIAIIGRTFERCAEVHRLLAEAGMEAELIGDRKSEYRGGVSVVPVHLAKGLEFDAVLITDADSRTYGRRALDAKLLYVACTRALHRLMLLYKGEPSPLIAD